MPSGCLGLGFPVWSAFAWIGVHSSGGLRVGLAAARGLGFVFDGCVSVC